jgi:hypothetical protein
MTRRVVIALVLGFATGFFLEVITVVIASIWAFISDSSVTIPGVWMVKAIGPSDLRGLDFAPNFGGLAIALIVVAGIFVAGAVYLGHPRRAESRQPGK